MGLHLDIKSGIKQAMLGKDELKLSVFRGLLADFVNEQVTKKRKPDEMLADEEALAVIKRAAKKRMDSIEQFRAGGREDLAKAEEAELGILKLFIPAGMPREEIKVIALKKKEEMGISDKTKSGILTGAIMKDLKGKADGADVKAVVDEILS